MKIRELRHALHLIEDQESEVNKEMVMDLINGESAHTHALRKIYSAAQIEEEVQADTESGFMRTRSIRIIRFHKRDAYYSDDAVKIGTRIKIDKILHPTHGEFWALKATIEDKKSRRNREKVTFHAVKVELI